MSPTQVFTALLAMVKANRPAMLWGPPGVGKSTLFRQLADHLGIQFLDFRLPLFDPVDLRGIPFPDGDTARWLAPSFLPREGSGIVLLDELPQSPPSTQAAAMQLILDRRIGEYELPVGWIPFAAGNRVEDRAGAGRVLTPVLNRFLHLTLEVSHADWDSWALSAGIHPMVRSYLRWQPDKLMTFNPAKQENAFATPRSWEFVSQVLPHTPPDVLFPVLAGAVGEAPAAGIVGFMRIHDELPDLDLLLSHPESTPIPETGACLFALTGALAERCKGMDKQVTNACFVIADRLATDMTEHAGREFATLLARDILAINSDIKAQAELIQLPAANVFVKRHHSLLQAAMAK